MPATRLVERLVESPQVEIGPQTDEQFQAAFERYAARPNQRWSLAECGGFIAIEERGISEALAHDRGGRHCIRINDQWRVRFIWTDEGAMEIEVVDYR